MLSFFLSLETIAEATKKWGKTYLVALHWNCLNFLSPLHWAARLPPWVLSCQGNCPRRKGYITASHLQPSAVADTGLPQLWAILAPDSCEGSQVTCGDEFLKGEKSARARRGRPFTNAYLGFCVTNAYLGFCVCSDSYSVERECNSLS